ncbi:hypothetical protein KEM56_000873 [Ascosphaera pollenicola]|nr:hypothetical protein KEM56_000873 [Ascosphaera pollenicola]
MTIYVRLRDPDERTKFLAPSKILDRVLEELVAIEAEKGVHDYDSLLKEVGEFYAKTPLDDYSSGETRTPTMQRKRGEMDDEMGLGEAPENEIERLESAIVMIRGDLKEARKRRAKQTVMRCEDTIESMAKMVDAKEGRYIGLIELARLRDLGWLCPNCNLFVGDSKWLVCPSCQPKNTPAFHEREKRQKQSDADE